MSHYSFPLLKKAEIRVTLGELNIPVTEDDLENPAGWKVKQIYEHLIELLLNQRREEMTTPVFSAIEQLEFPELHEESVAVMAFLKAWCVQNPRGPRPHPRASLAPPAFARRAAPPPTRRPARLRAATSCCRRRASPTLRCKTSRSRT